MALEDLMEALRAPVGLKDGLGGRVGLKEGLVGRAAQLRAGNPASEAPAREVQRLLGAVEKGCWRL